MSQTDTSEPDTCQPLSHKLCMKDFLSESQPIKNHNKNYSQNDIIILKNQREFGHRKRIKP
jgi:hypothetical protein